MGRIMAVDVGQKRFGIAVTDPLRIIATGLDTVPSAEIFRYLKDYIGKERVDLIVVGSPVTMNNQPSQAVKYVDPFVRKLKKEFSDIPVRPMDERFTSGMARKAIIEAGAGYRARRDKAKVDMVSAVILLQSFLDQENFSKI